MPLIWLALTLLILVLLFMDVAFILVPMAQRRMFPVWAAVVAGTLITGVVLPATFFCLLLAKALALAGIVFVLGLGHIGGLFLLYRPQARIREKIIEVEAGKNEELLITVRQRAAEVPVRKIDLGRSLRDGRECRQNGDLEGTLYNLLLAIRARPENPFPYVQLGEVCAEQGWWQGARKYYDLALRYSSAIGSPEKRKEYEVDVLRRLREVREQEK